MSLADADEKLLAAFFSYFTARSFSFSISCSISLFFERSSSTDDFMCDSSLLKAYFS